MNLSNISWIRKCSINTPRWCCYIAIQHSDGSPLAMQPECYRGWGYWWQRQRRPPRHALKLDSQPPLSPSREMKTYLARIWGQFHQTHSQRHFFFPTYCSHTHVFCLFLLECWLYWLCWFCHLSNKALPLTNILCLLLIHSKASNV